MLKSVVVKALGMMIVLSACCGCSDSPDARDSSVARLWNELLLQAIRDDFARPTVHARNLFHVSSAMYDAWASASASPETSSTYLAGKTVAGFECRLDSFDAPLGRDVALEEESVSFAAYRLISYRFRRSPGQVNTRVAAEGLMETLGYDITNTSTDLSTASGAALGNRIAECYIAYGLQDGSNERNDFANVSYQPVNLEIEPELPGNPNIVDLNRWQQISLAVFVDQSGNVVSSVPEFLSPEWGSVNPFALQAQDASVYQRDDFDYRVYFDPGLPPQLGGALSEQYQWNFALVSIWSSHLDPASGVEIDISPASLGNNDLAALPSTFENFNQFYDLFNGGDIGSGYAANPVTGAAYPAQRVPLGDYARVLAEFWADGPDSETPPGHWFVILNEVSDHTLFERRFGGTGRELNPLEFDVKAYFTLGGAMHDSAIAAWGIKGWYDYLRPVSAIRAMADLGQSSSATLPSYHVNGLPLYDGFIALVESGDPLAGDDDVNVGKIKLYAWQGPDFIIDAAVDTAGVGWILAENWWPYQRPTFVSPPFAGYISGHSTYSRAAAEVLTAITGDPYFPGGVGEFPITANEFLVFEEGPSVDMTLQWATYRDASDQCSLSRIWGGIHPPADDIPGRIIGEQIGIEAFAEASAYIAGNRD